MSSHQYNQAQRTGSKRSGGHLRIAAGALILFLCAASVNAKDCVNEQPEEGPFACPCIVPSNDRGLFGRSHLHRRISNFFNGIKDIKNPVGWSEMTAAEKCARRYYCDYLIEKPAPCCIAICEAGIGGGSVCSNEHDCRTLRDGAMFWKCIAERECLEWNYSDCRTEYAPIQTGPKSNDRCICREYNKRCS